MFLLSKAQGLALHTGRDGGSFAIPRAGLCLTRSERLPDFSPQLAWLRAVLLHLVLEYGSTLLISGNIYTLSMTQDSPPAHSAPLRLTVVLCLLQWPAPKGTAAWAGSESPALMLTF